MKNKLGKDLRDILNYTEPGLEWINDLEDDEEDKIEIDRINKIKCPVCKSKEKHRSIQRDSNGIMGPGHSSWTVEEYFVCKKCGVMYKDLKSINEEEN